jgi:hypothetical protein
MYHPAAALHQASLRETLVRDIRGLPAALLAAREAIEAERMRREPSDPEPAAGSGGGGPMGLHTEEPDQLTLF